MPMEKHIVSKDPGVYEAWPDVVQTENGRLVCVFAECTHHEDRSGARLAICTSDDRGRTWSTKRYLTEKGTKTDYFNCPRISALRDGRLAIVCDRIHGGFDAADKAELYLWYGDGEHWDAPKVYPFRGIVPDKLLQLESGRLILSNHRGNPATGQPEQHLWYSDDGGVTWSREITVAADPKYALCEANILDCGGGVLVAFLRENSRLGYDIFKTISYNSGESWSELIPTGMCAGHRPTAGFLRDGRVMVTYRFIPVWMHSIFAAFFTRETALSAARPRKDLRVMPLDYDRNPTPDLGYTGWAQFDDGEIYVVNYIKDDSSKAHIRGYSFRPEDVILPQEE